MANKCNKTIQSCFIVLLEVIGRKKLQQTAEKHHNCILRLRTFRTKTEFAEKFCLRNFFLFWIGRNLIVTESSPAEWLSQNFCTRSFVHILWQTTSSAPYQQPSPYRRWNPWLWHRGRWMLYEVEIFAPLVFALGGDRIKIFWNKILLYAGIWPAHQSLDHY